MRSADRVAAVALGVLGLLVVWQAGRLPLWQEPTAGPGFMPLCLGVALIAGAAAILLEGSRSAARADEPPFLDREGSVRLLVITGCALGAALLAGPVGFVTAAGLFMAAVLFYLVPGRPATAAVAAVSTSLVVWLVFERWLAVPLPRGPLGF